MSRQLTIETNAATGKTRKRWRDVPDHVEAEAKAESDRMVAQMENDTIRAQLAENDVKHGVRAIAEALDGDSTRLEWLKKEQAALRAKMRPE